MINDKKNDAWWRSEAHIDQAFFRHGLATKLSNRFSHPQKQGQSLPPIIGIEFSSWSMTSKAYNNTNANTILDYRLNFDFPFATKTTTPSREISKGKEKIGKMQLAQFHLPFGSELFQGVSFSQTWFISISIEVGTTST